MGASCSDKYLRDLKMLTGSSYLLSNLQGALDLSLRSINTQQIFRMRDLWLTQEEDRTQGHKTPKPQTPK